MSKSKCVGLVLAVLMIAILVPFSVIAYAQRSEEERAEKFVELAERAEEKVEDFIGLIYVNQTAIDTIKNANLKDELDANETLFETWGLGNLTAALDALKATPPNYPGAIANASEALNIFREVFKALNTILAEAGVARGELVDAQGLIEAMERALQRIEKLREIVPDEILPILKAAEAYLNVTAAREWLAEGRVNETAWNLTQANKLISLAHSSLKKKAGELNVKRIESYLNVIEKFYDRIERLVVKAVEKGLPEASTLEDQLETAVKPLLEDAKDAFKDGNYGEALAKLVDARNMLKEIERDLSELR